MSVCCCGWDGFGHWRFGAASGARKTVLEIFDAARRTIVLTRHSFVRTSDQLVARVAFIQIRQHTHAGAFVEPRLRRQARGIDPGDGRDLISDSQRFARARVRTT